MRPMLRNFWIGSLAGPEESPVDVSDFWLPVFAEIGPQDGEGTDSFLIYVASPERYREYCHCSPNCTQEKVLQLEQFSWPAVEQALLEICAPLEADSWDEVCDLLDQIFEPQ